MDYELCFIGTIDVCPLDAFPEPVGAMATAGEGEFPKACAFILYSVKGASDFCYP